MSQEQEYDPGVKCTTAGELMEALSAFDLKLPIMVGVMDGSDTVWITG